MAMVIRLARPDDEKFLRRLIMRYLKETFEQGGDFPATLENAAAFTQYAIQGAAEGDPCLVADVDGVVVGFVVARGVNFPGLTTRDRTVRSWGSYVHPDHRRHSYAVKLFVVAARLAAAAGYTRFLGITHGSNYEENGLRAIKAVGVFKEVGKVLMVDLRDMVCMAGQRLNANFRREPIPEDEAPKLDAVVAELSDDLDGMHG